MKKILLIIAMLFLPTIVYAAENSSLADEETYNKLKQGGYLDEEIALMDEKAIESSLNIIEGTTPVSRSTIYIKTMTRYTYDGKIIEKKEEYITEDEYNNSNESEIAPLSHELGWETEYKKLSTTIRGYNRENKYIVQTWLNWKKMPRVKNIDLFGARFDNMTLISNSNFYTNIKKDNFVTQVFSPSENEHWLKIFNNGFAVAFSIEGTYSQLGLYSQFDAKKINTSKHGFVYTTYQHAQLPGIDKNYILNYVTLSSSGLGEVIQLSKYKAYYDGMQGVYVTTQICDPIE